jgi:hypothetical protein
MKNLTLSIVTMLFVMQFCLAQTLPQSLPVLKTGWERVFLKNVGSFDIPPTLEVQKGKYKEYADERKNIQGYDASQLVAQTKGLNDFVKEGVEKYARVLMSTTIGAPGDYENLNFNQTTYTQSDITELNKLYKQQILESFSGNNLNLIEWYPLKLEKVNGMSCIHISYKRQLQDKPFVLVNTFIFHNYDRMHSITLSYRLSEENYWKSDFASILKSFRISNVKNY